MLCESARLRCTTGKAGIFPLKLAVVGWPASTGKLRGGEGGGWMGQGEDRTGQNGQFRPWSGRACFCSQHLFSQYKAGMAGEVPLYGPSHPPLVWLAIIWATQKQLAVTSSHLSSLRAQHHQSWAHQGCSVCMGPYKIFHIRPLQVFRLDPGYKDLVVLVLMASWLWPCWKQPSGSSKTTIKQISNIRRDNQDQSPVLLGWLQLLFAWLRLTMHTTITTDAILFMVISHLPAWQVA